MDLLDKFVINVKGGLELNPIANCKVNWIEISYVGSVSHDSTLDVVGMEHISK